MGHGAWEWGVEPGNGVWSLGMMRRHTVVANTKFYVLCIYLLQFRFSTALTPFIEMDTHA